METGNDGHQFGEGWNGGMEWNGMDPEWDQLEGPEWKEHETNGERRQRPPQTHDTNRDNTSPRLGSDQRVW